MEFFTNIYETMTNTFGGSIWVLLPIVSFILIVAQWRLYSKAGQSGIQSIVPFWNFVGFMKIVGRPIWHSLFIIIPLLGMIGAMAADGGDLMSLASSGFASFAETPVSATVFGISAFAFIVFMVRVHIDLCNSFGRSSVIDYVMMIGLNILYVLYLGLDYEIEYQGPSYGVEAGYQDSNAYA